MTKISVYQIDEYVTADDKWIGTDVNTYNKTKNFTPRKLAVYFNGSQVINTGVDLLYKYFTITPPEDRPIGTLSFETEIGPTVNFSAISTFLLSKTTQKGNDVSDFLNFLVNSTSLIYKAKNVNLFGSYKIVSVEPYFLDPNFFVVNVDFLEGNGFIEEDEDYMISIVDLDRTVEVPQLVKETFEYTSSNSFVVANEINNILQVIVNTTSLHPEAYSYTLPSTITIINDLEAGDVITVVYNYIEEFLDVPDLQRVTNIGNHTTNDIIIDNVPGEYGGYTVSNTLNDLGTFQSYTSPINVDYQSVYSAYEMSINEIYSPTINFEMLMTQGIIQTSYTNSSNYNSTSMYSGNSVNGPSLYIGKNNVAGQLKVDNLTENITLQFPDKPAGTYTIATTADVSPSALVFLDEGNGNGIARSDRNPAFFGNIGLDAFDISYADGVDSPTTDNGATGEQSFAAGISVRSRNYLSSSFGYLINNNGEGSFDTGYNLKDVGYTNFVTGMGHDVTSANSTVVGQASNIIVSGIDDYNAYPTKPLFVVGNGTIQNGDPDYNVLTRSDAFIVRMNGLATLPSVTNALIDADATGKALVTKEYVATLVLPTFLEYNAIEKTVWNNGQGNIAANTSFGASALKTNTTGTENSAFGVGALRNNTSGSYNTAIGFSLLSNTVGSNNISIGYISQADATIASSNVSIGNSSLYWNIDGNGNTAIGHESGVYETSNPLTKINNSVFIGKNTRAFAVNDTNEIVIGADATGVGSNTATLGNDSITSTILKGLVKAPLTTNALIDADATGKSLVTKEYGAANYASTTQLASKGGLSTINVWSLLQKFSGNISIDNDVAISNHLKLIIQSAVGNTLTSNPRYYDYTTVGRNDGVGVGWESGHRFNVTSSTEVEKTAIQIESVSGQLPKVTFPSNVFITGTFNLAKLILTPTDYNIIDGGNYDDIGFNVKRITSSPYRGIDIEQTAAYGSGWMARYRFMIKGHDDSSIYNGLSVESTSSNGISLVTIPGDLSVRKINATGVITLKNYTVATLPTGVQGDTAYVTDATAPTYLGTLTGGGAVTCPVFYNGTNWIT